MDINGFDCDGVITVGIYPGPHDVIITGRSIEEEPETKNMLNKRGILNQVYYNNIKFDEKTRQTSGMHKANTLIKLKQNGVNVINFFEDDPIQKYVIEKYCSWINVIHVKHELTEKENVKHINDF